jgi:tRNA(Ile)-lysidine synthase
LDDCYNVRMKMADFQAICVKSCGLDPSFQVLAGFSGGADSLALLILLKNAGYRVVAAHFNHHLRQEADLDEICARQLAADLEIPFLSGGADVQVLACEHKQSVEEAARQARYQWLLKQAETRQAQAVAVAHTADDQVETVLMHLLRGSGLDGLTGMPYRQIFPLWNQRIPIARPLLTTWRSETEAICRESGLEPVMDESNLSARYFRNRIRLELIPFLQTYNTQVKGHIRQTAQILSEDQSILNTVKERAWLDCYRQRTPGWIAWNLESLAAQPEGLRRYIFRRGLTELKPGIRDIDYSLTERLSNFIFQISRSGEMHLAGNLWIQKCAGQVILWDGKPGFIGLYPQLETDYGLSLSLVDIVEFSGWKLETREEDLLTAREAIQQGRLQNQVWLDIDCLNFPLVVRAGHPGERISLLGMGGKTQKLSDYYINHKIPRQAREKWPLIVSGQSIVWVTGFGISESAAITERTRRVVRISLQSPHHLPNGSTYC